MVHNIFHGRKHYPYPTSLTSDCRLRVCSTGFRCFREDLSVPLKTKKYFETFVTVFSLHNNVANGIPLGAMHAPPFSPLSLVKKIQHKFCIFCCMKRFFLCCAVSTEDDSQNRCYMRFRVVLLYERIKTTK